MRRGDLTKALLMLRVRVRLTRMAYRKSTIHTLDIALEDGTGDKEFLNTIEYHLPKLINSVKPDFIFYLAGVDILETDKLGKLACSIEGCKKRDELVLSLCAKNQIPVQVSMGGGYSPNIKTIIEAHSNTYRVATNLFH